MSNRNGSGASTTPVRGLAEWSWRRRRPRRAATGFVLSLMRGDRRFESPSRAPLRQTLGGRCAARGSLLCYLDKLPRPSLGATSLNPGGPVLNVEEGPVPDV